MLTRKKTRRRKWVQVPKYPGIRSTHDGKRFVVRKMIGGKRRAAHFPSLDAAIAYRNQQNEIAAQNRLEKHGLVTDKFPLVELWKLYLTDCEQHLRPSTVQSYREAGSRLWPFFEKLRVEDLTPDHVRRFVEECRRKNLSARSIRFSVTLLGMMIRFGIREQKLKSNPIQFTRLPKMQQGEKEALTPDEYERLLNHQHPLKGRGKPCASALHCECHVLWLAFGETGMRLSEVRFLTWEQVDLEGKWIDLFPTERYALKNAASADRIAMTDRLAEALLIHRETVPHNPNDLVFPTGSGKVQDRKLIYQKLRRCLKAAGIDRKCGPHIFRHSVATWLGQRGATALQIKEVLRHADLRMVTRYTHLGDDDKRKAMYLLAVKGAVL